MFRFSEYYNWVSIKCQLLARTLCQCPIMTEKAIYVMMEETVGSVLGISKTWHFIPTIANLKLHFQECI